MKQVFLAALIFLGSYTLARAGNKLLAPDQTSVLGEWDLTSRACTSNTPLNDGAVQINVRFNDDETFELKRIVAGCQTEIKGTYAIDGRKINFMAVTSQSCNDTSPQPMPDTYSMYAAYLNETELVLVATGTKAAACPATDALILNYEKLQPSLR